MNGVGVMKPNSANISSILTNTSSKAVHLPLNVQLCGRKWSVAIKSYLMTCMKRALKPPILRPALASPAPERLTDVPRAMLALSWEGHNPANVYWHCLSTRR
jgi:hypothetical protein